MNFSNQSYFDACHVNSESGPTKPHTLLATVLIIIVNSLLCLTTILGNVLVIITIIVDKNLRKTGHNYFLLSLAVADLMIGLISMPLFSNYILQSGWTLGPLICDLWLALDYLCSNASVLNLLMISFDRYIHIVHWTKSKKISTTRARMIMISSAWIISFLLWPPWILAWPYIEGERTVPPDRCYIQFLETNSYITVITALIAFYVPVIVMCYLYYSIWKETHRSTLFRIDMYRQSRGTFFLASHEGQRKCSCRLKELFASCIDCDDGGEDDTSPGTTPSSMMTPIQSSRNTSVSIVRPDQITEQNMPEEIIYNVVIQLRTTQDEQQSSVTMIPEPPSARLPPPMRSSLSTSALIGQSVSNSGLSRCSSTEALSASRLIANNKPNRFIRLYPKKKSKDPGETEREKSLRAERKAARVLSAILAAFIFTWTPYNVLVLVKSVETFISCEDMISQTLWDISYYLCYINSMLNPICYALASVSFRKTYWRILTCRWSRRARKSLRHWRAS